jgi:hypothetical protein
VFFLGVFLSFLPDSSFRVYEISRDTTWEKIESFGEKSSGYTFSRIDALHPGAIDRINEYAKTIFVIGDINMPFTKTYPLKHQKRKF